MWPRILKNGRGEGEEKAEEKIRRR